MNAIRCLAILICCFAFALPLRAQQEPSAPLVVPFAQFPPFLFLDENGQRTGFIAELAELLGAEIGVPIDYLEVEGAREWVAAQAAGDAQFIPGVLRIPGLQATNVFSNEIAEDILRPAVLASNEELISAGVLEGQRVAVVPPAVGSEDPVLNQNTVATYGTPQEAVVDLLSGKVDAVLLPPPIVYGIARDAGVDGRITFIGEPLREAKRFVALHESRAELMPAINAAIARMEADGRLEALRQRYNINVPPPPPETLIIGINHAPPYGIIGQDGDVSGFTAEMWADLARLANLSVQFAPVTGEVYSAGPSVEGGIDASGLLLISEDRASRMDFTSPLQKIEYQLFFRTDNPPEDLNNPLENRSIGVLPQSLSDETRSVLANQDVINAPSIDALVDGLIDGTYDKILTLPQAAQELFVERGVADQIQTIPDTFFRSGLAPALRPGLGSVRERLNAVIPGYLLSDEYSALEQKYFSEPVFWTRARIIWSLVAAGSGLLLVLGGLGLQNLRTKARSAAAVAVVRDELDTIFNATTNGIVALDAEGQIVRVNNRARHFLGGVSDPVPFAWPTGIDFLESETLHPLDNSKDPIKRALAGNTLRNETHLMRRPQAGEEQRYVRIESARPETTEGAIHTVLVIDDISQEERNRQVVERKSRLDALGQLTGGIAHDFNNLLASLLYAVDLARRAKTEDKREGYLETAMSSLVRGRTLTSRLLAFARKQPGIASARKTSDVFDEFQMLVRPMLEAQIEIAFHVDEPGLRQYCDATQLETALMNLTLNARDAILRAGKGSKIDIRARPVRAPNKDLDKRQETTGAETANAGSFRYVEISVMDNGPGMDKETLARCTDPFFTTKDSNSGTGLGLAMVYGFIRQSDGDLRIYSEEGVGTTVQMTLPRGSELGGREEPVAKEHPVRGDAQTILVVDDELPLLEGLADVLRELGYVVISARSGPEAMQLVEDGAGFDLLLTDVVMPGAFGGFELARRVREKHPDVPVIYTSGYTGFSAQEMGEVQAPMLQKPALPSELASAIANALSSKDGA